MSTAGLVLKPLTPSEAARSRSLSGPARTRTPETTATTNSQIAQNAQSSVLSRLSGASFAAEVSKKYNDRGAETGQSASQSVGQSFGQSIGQATPGTGMLSSGVLATLQNNRSGAGATQVQPQTRDKTEVQSIRSETGDGASKVQKEQTEKIRFNPAAPNALQAYGRAGKIVDKVRTATATQVAAQEAAQQAANAVNTSGNGSQAKTGVSNQPSPKIAPTPAPKPAPVADYPVLSDDSTVNSLSGNAWGGPSSGDLLPA